MDILDNVVPYIGSEEEKMEAETLKLLGTLEGHTVKPLHARMSAHCNRVPVVDGHTDSVLDQTRQQARNTRRTARRLGRVPSPRRTGSAHGARAAYRVGSAEDRPQPRLDRNRGNGMAVTVGRLRPCGVLDWKFTVLSHNTIRGAAGAAILNAELLASLGKLEPVAAAASRA